MEGGEIKIVLLLEKEPFPSQKKTTGNYTRMECNLNHLNYSDNLGNVLKELGIIPKLILEGLTLGIEIISLRPVVWFLASVYQLHHWSQQCIHWAFWQLRYFCCCSCVTSNNHTIRSFDHWNKSAEVNKWYFCFSGISTSALTLGVWRTMGFMIIVHIILFTIYKH